MVRVCRLLVALALVGCHPAAPPPEAREKAAPPPKAAGSVAASEPTLSPPPPPAPTPWPSAVDPATPAPTGARIVGVAADGKVLLAMTGYQLRPPTAAMQRMGAAFGGPAPANKLIPTQVEVQAVLDPKTLCLEEVHAFPALERARDPDLTPSNDPNLAAPLNAAPVAPDLARARTLAARFGVRTVAGVAFGTDAGAAVTGDTTYLYASKGGVFKEVPWGASHSATASPDGATVAVAACGSPCGGNYPLVLLDTATSKTRRAPSGNVAGHDDLRWSPDGRVVYYPFNEATSGLQHTRTYCVGALDAKSLKKTTLVCLTGKPSGGRSVTGTFAISPQGRAMAMTADVGGTDEVVVYDVTFALADAAPRATERYRAPGRPLFPRVDDGGRVAWTDNDAPDFHMRVHVTRPGGVETFDDAEVVGFLHDGSLLVLPNPRPSHAPARTKTLAMVGRCDLFRRQALAR